MTGPGFLPVRQLVLVDLLSMMLSVHPGQRVLIGIDGVDGAGKSRLAAELVALAPHVAGREVRSVSIDGFHHPRARRHARGTGPETFYQDSYDYEAFRASVLRPFRVGEDYVPAVHDVRTDHAVSPAPVTASDDALLLVDGIFLRRPELAAEWDATLLVLVPLSVSVPRGNARFEGRPEGADDPAHEANARYVGGQQLYLQQARLHPPTWILDNTDLQRPALLEPDPEEPQWLELP
ncbi:uridine kinase [Ornithinimicrobium cryptoxanthini]|uniref:Uridine kinase n=1 Tax=Ornithinimicrobium cryptoxanthini TaxID=2934161 RepID=A0ABY4YEZ1_9MICO|nr:uridine kinase [Ornithinimicrobium cryptoxanthini]USQ75167.1 uridine kinase [Ornithinimicrobium cryptoxanthini]